MNIKIIGIAAAVMFFMILFAVSKRNKIRKEKVEKYHQELDNIISGFEMLPEYGPKDIYYIFMNHDESISKKHITYTDIIKSLEKSMSEYRKEIVKGNSKQTRILLRREEELYEKCLNEQYQSKIAIDRLKKEKESAECQRLSAKRRRAFDHALRFAEKVFDEGKFMCTDGDQSKNRLKSKIYKIYL